MVSGDLVAGYKMLKGRRAPGQCNARRDQLNSRKRKRKGNGRVEFMKGNHGLPQ